MKSPPRRSPRLQQGATPSKMETHNAANSAAAGEANPLSVSTAAAEKKSSAMDKHGDANQAPTAAGAPKGTANQAPTAAGAPKGTANQAPTAAGAQKGAPNQAPTTAGAKKDSRQDEILYAMQRRIVALEQQLHKKQVSQNEAYAQQQPTLDNFSYTSGALSVPPEPHAVVTVTSVPALSAATASALPASSHALGAVTATSLPTSMPALSDATASALPASSHALGAVTATSLPTSMPALSAVTASALPASSHALGAVTATSLLTSMPAHSAATATRLPASMYASATTAATYMPSPLYAPSGAAATSLPMSLHAPAAATAISMPSIYASMPPASTACTFSSAAGELNFANGLQYIATPNNIYCQPPSRHSIYGPTHMQPSPAYSPSVHAPRKIQDLPQFNGQAEDWPIFYAAFMQSTAAYAYSNLENNQRLQKCLTGAARETVKSLLIHPDNVSAIIEQLQFRFGRPDQLIRSQLNQVREIQPIPEHAVGRLIPFATKAKNLAVFLQSVNGQHHLANPTLLEELVAKLPMSKRVEWARYAALIQPYPTILNFSNWLNDLANVICTVQDCDGKEPKRRMVLHATEGIKLAPEKCPICQGHHKASECSRLIDATVPERWTMVKDYRLCFSCLKPGHSTRTCRKKGRCTVAECKRKHHKLLHDQSMSAAPQPRAESDGAVEAVLNCASSGTTSSNLLFRVLPVTLYGPNKVIDTYALLDEGSSVTMLDDTLVNELGLRRQPRQLSIQWVGGRVAQETAALVDVCISGAGMKKKHMLKNVYGVSNLNLPTQSLKASDISRAGGHSHGPPLQTYDHAMPKLLIGLDHCHLGISTTSRRSNKGGPYAALTELGWVVFGPTATVMHSEPTCLFTNAARDDSLHTLIAEYFETENFGIKAAPPIESKADTRAKAILESTTKLVDGRFETGLLWSRDDVALPDSYSMALRRLIGIERKMKKDDNYSTAYSTIMKSYVAKNYARKLSPAEAATVGPRTWYLPHFGVVNPNKPAKMRLVFDAAAEVKGISLNSFLLKGPQQYQPLPSMLFHFREGAIAVCGDIREMFHQILITPEDRCAQRFLWRDGDDSKPPEVFEMVAMTFGAACSPCAAQYVKNINALKYQQQHPRAVKAITDHHYVDDFVDSFESAEEAIEIAIQVREIHKGAGFELRNFCSNSTEVLNALAGITTDVPLSDKSSLQTEKILGMYWQPATDEFRFDLKFERVDKGIIAGCRNPTKRELLSIVMSVFDPLGLLGHFIVSIKLLMREVWRHEIRWDEELPDQMKIPWIMWREQLPRVIEFSVPRFYFRAGVPRDVQVHVFVDASQDAFAAVSYWRVETVDRKVSTAFICAKTKCAPLKLLSIPRLELQAAVLGARLLKTVLDEHSVKVSRCVIWSDSKTVIKWINSKHRRYKPFVAHRIAEILSTTKQSDWSWIPTLENVADEATRSNGQVDLRPTSRWLKGPAFLLQCESSWPIDTSVKLAADDKIEPDDEEELRPKYSLMVVSNQFINFKRFSSFRRLVRTTAWMLRFAVRCRKQRTAEQANGLTALEVDAAENLLCRLAQREGFAIELQQIECEKNLSKDSALYKLLPYIDDHGLLRVKGRIDLASWLPLNTKRPIILPPSHEYTALVVAHHHQNMKHQNTEATICEIRRKYWIPRLRQILRKIINSCNICKIAKTMPVAPVMGPLPQDRLTPFMRPFTYTGLDYFGPLTVTIGRRTEKRWIALFTCLVTRAIHLEVAHDLSTDACILAIRNFTNRRGLPVKIRSDNGTNFVGVDKEAKRFAEVFDCERLQEELSSKGVQWVFNCPANPSEGGVWERMVQCVKRVLRHTLKETSPREHTLQCFIIEAENLVNSRPLTHLPVSADEEEPLTPNHFLLGSANTAQTPAADEPMERACALRKQWRIARQLRDSFWKRWIGEYLPTLTRREKWCQRSTPVKEGDLVLICDKNMPRQQWCRGRIDRVYAGTDGEIRRADVHTSKGTVQRPVTKLAVLDIERSES